MKHKIKKYICLVFNIILYIFIFNSLFISNSAATSVTDLSFNMSDYTKNPAFISNEIPPNVIFALDISGSMKAVAYRDTGAGNWKTGMHDDYNDAVSYYGYFNSDDKYTYDQTKGFFKVDNASGEWDGNFMNWLCMRRIDVARKVMVGGKVTVNIGGTEYNRNRVPSWVGWNNWYIMDGQHEPYDYEFTKQFTTSNTYATLYPDSQIFLISEGKLIPQSTSSGDVVQLSAEVEMGEVTMSWDEADASTYGNWTWVPFANTYNEPRVVAKTLTFNGSDPTSDPRIMLYTDDPDSGGTEDPWPHTNSKGFIVRLQEWDYRDGNHTTESFAYVVVESATAAAAARGWIPITDDQGGTWGFQAVNGDITLGSGDYCGDKFGDPPRKGYNFDMPITNAPWNAFRPVVLSGVATYNGSSAIVTRNFYYNNGSPQYINIQEQEVDRTGDFCAHNDEKIHIIAIQPPPPASITSTPYSATITYNGKTNTVQAGLTTVKDYPDRWTTITYDATRPFMDKPYFIADMTSTSFPYVAAEWEPASIRVAGTNGVNTNEEIKLFVMEEKSSDNELTHPDEDVCWFAVEGGGKYNIRVGVEETGTRGAADSTEPEGIIQDISGSMRIGLAVYNYDHVNKTPSNLYNGNKVHGGTLKPCYPDASKELSTRTNYDICLSCGVNDPVANTIQAIEEHPLIWGTTPIAETLYEIMEYIKQDNGAYTDGDGYYDDLSTAEAFPYGATNDPFYYPSDSTTLPCAKTFVLHFNDGAPYTDWDDAHWTASPVAHPNIGANVDSDGDGETQNEMLDDLAYYMRNTDLRTDLNGHQEVITYYVYAALGEGEQYNTSTKRMRESAANGGFEDFDDDHTPDPLHPSSTNSLDGQSNINNYITSNENPSGSGIYDCSGQENEWDQDGDCNPDTFYQADNGYQLVNQLMAAFQSILQRSSSGTAASVISNSRSGEGAIYQSIFYPQNNDVNDNSVEWTGQLHAMLVDSYGNMREDTNNNNALDMVTDRIIEFDGTAIKKYADTDGNGLLEGTETTEVATGSMSDIDLLWSSSDWLNEISDANITLQRTYDTTSQKRYIFTFVDEDQDMVADSGEQVDFKFNSAHTFPGALDDDDKIYAYINVYPPILGASPTQATPSEVETLRQNCLSGSCNGFNEYLEEQTERIINFVRGEDQGTYSSAGGYGYTLPAFRARQIDYDDDSTVETWRLGDVVSSSPTLVAGPAEDFDQLYGDDSYRVFSQKYKDRRNVVYLGGNDGMFHAFNGGFFSNKHKAFLTRPLESGDPFETNASDPEFPTWAAGYSAHDLGMELWAYIPYNQLPHLHWLSDPDYSHIYYNDLKPKIFDAKIFSSSAANDTAALAEKHPYGWGTILIGGMSFGGGEIIADMDKTDGGYDSSQDRVMSSSLFILDITDPEDPPTVLGEISLDGMGFTTCYPAVVVVKDKNEDGAYGDYASGENRWYLVFGSGPADSNGWAYGKNGWADGDALEDAASYQGGKIFVMDLVELASNGTLCMKENASNNCINLATTDPWFADLGPTGFGDANGFVSRPVVVDWFDDWNYNSDVVYFGTVEGNPAAGYGGRIRRIRVDTNVPDPGDTSTWTADSTVIDLTDIGGGTGQPIVTPLSLGVGETRYYGASPGTPVKDKWLYFGTGRFYTTADSTDTDQQSYYGIKETQNSSDGSFTWTTVPRGNLLNVSNYEVYEEDYIYTGSGWTDFDAVKTNVKDNYEGWLLNFPNSKERNVGQAVLFGDIVTFTSYIPSNDPCSYEGVSYLYALHYLTGTGYPEPVIGTGTPTRDTTAAGAAAAEQEVSRRISLGDGLSESPNVHTGKESGSRAFVQTSTGAIITIDEANPGAVKSGRIFWKEE